ncbi:MAG: hypothetical protein ABIJ53_07935, partial [Verrucomicrobiota bacterium]
MSKLRTLAALLLISSGALADRVVLEDRFDKIDTKLTFTVPVTGSRGSIGGDHNSVTGQPLNGLTLKEFGFLQYRIG